MDWVDQSPRGSFRAGAATCPLTGPEERRSALPREGGGTRAPQRGRSTPPPPGKGAQGEDEGSEKMQNSVRNRGWQLSQVARCSERDLGLQEGMVLRERTGGSRKGGGGSTRG